MSVSQNIFSKINKFKYNSYTVETSVKNLINLELFRINLTQDKGLVL